MRNINIPSHRRHERGQTIILVAVAIVSLLAMAALAIDVVTLYVARTEIQRAADAAALAGAKGIADSGVTTLQPGDINLSTVETMAQSMALSSINAVLPVNPVGGTAPSLVGTPTVTYNTPNNNNPQITVTLQRTGLPTFFARILGQRTALVTASATAEVYNPANTQNFTPISLSGVKPWLVANQDPTLPTTPPFVTTSSGLVRPAIGETFSLQSDCQPGPDCSNLIDITPQATYSKDMVDYVPAVVAPTIQQCPCAGSSDYEYSIGCYDPTPYQCGATTTTWDPHFINPDGNSGPTATATECLIHTSAGQDTLDPLLWPPGPMKITAGSGAESGQLVTTSSSIVTIPILDPGTFNPLGGPVTIVGFLQAFINQVDTISATGPGGNVNITVLNVAGCSNTPIGASPLVGGMGTSPVPVRLITPP